MGKIKRGSGDITLNASGENLTAASVVIPTEEVKGLPEVPEGGDGDEYEYEDLPEEVTNIFLNKEVRASTENPKGATGSEIAVKANDGDDYTKWCAANGTYPQWWECDLGSEYSIENINLSFETQGKTYYYTVAVSDEPMTDENYAEHIIIDNSQGSTETACSLENVKGRYVRVTFTKAASGEWAVLREVSGLGTTSNIALNKPVSASSVNSGRNGLEKAEYANDGNADTKWCAKGGAGTSGHWWQVDLKDTYKISDILITMEFDDAAYKFVVQGSVDGKNYKTIKDFRETEGCGKNIQIQTDTIVQYLRIYDISTKNPSSQWPAIHEVEVYGEKKEYKLTSVSREKEAFASSCGLDSEPAHGSNGVPGWYWYPESMEDEWWYIDTKGIYDLDNIQMTWNKGENHKYIIDISTDGKEWTTIVDRSKEGIDAVRPYEAAEGIARYIRVRMPGERTSQQGFGLFDAYAPKPEERNVEKVEQPQAIETVKGTVFTELDLPKEVEVTLAGNIKTTLPVIWNEDGYHAETAGIYTIRGELKAIEGTALGEVTTVSVQVNVRAYGEKETYTVTINGKTAQYDYNAKVTTEAVKVPEGKVFAGWKLDNEDGEMVSNNERYTFYVANDTVLIPVFEDKAEEVQAKALLSNVMVTKTADNKSDVRYVGQLIIPEGYEIVNAGLVWSTKNTELIVDNKLNSDLKPTFINKISNTNQFSVTVKGVPEGYHFRGIIFATIKNRNGEEMFIYSNEHKAL